jgi:hypothetical protein
MTDEVDAKLEALLANVRTLIRSGFSREEATARKLEIDDQCHELLMLWLSKRSPVDANQYREAEAALERLREAVKKECDKSLPPADPSKVRAADGQTTDDESF